MAAMDEAITEAAQAQLQAYLQHLFDCVTRHISRHGFRMVQASGTISNLYVSLTEARTLLGAGVVPEPPGPGMGVLPAHALAQAAQVAEGWQALGEAWPVDDRLPIGALRLRFGLSDVEVRLLVAAAAPALSLDLARLYTFAWADFAVKRPTVAFLTELVADEPDELLRLHQCFTPDAPLVRQRLVELRDDATWGAPTPLLHRGVIVPDAVLEFLRIGHPSPTIGHRLAGACRHVAPERAPLRTDLLLPPAFLVEVDHCLNRSLMLGQGGRPRLLLIGPTGSGRHSAVASAVAPRGYGTLCVDLSRLPAEPDYFSDRLSEAAREALLRRSVLVLEGDDLFEDGEHWNAVAPYFHRIVDAHEGPLAVTARGPVSGLHRGVRDVYDIPIHLPNIGDQRRLWAQALDAAEWPMEDDLARKLGRRFSVAPGVIHTAIDEARARARVAARSGHKPPLTLENVAQAVRRRLEHALSQVAEPYRTTLTWDDVVLPDEVMETLKEILAQARNREKVYDDWGFRQKMSYGRGLACLFSGAPGTGKTMMAGIMARELGQEIYRVDLSRVVSKWIGETEKNLAKVFDEAESAQVILLFDEADSLFSARTEVKGSNDRFANMEINYLLQRMESYDGMTILTTNFEKSIDEAFKRRLKFRLNFPVPELEQRVKLWRSMIPKQANMADDVKFELLGKKFTMSGGNIKNAVLRAAFYAAEGDGVLTHALLDRAGTAESREMGRLI
jgi:AAA+ superfamily predicted ATPase